MRPAPVLLASILLLLPVAALAGGGDSKGPVIHTTCCDPPVRWGARHDARDARIAIKTRDGDAMLFLTDEVVAVQLSDRAMRKVRREIDEEKDADEDNPLADAIKSAVIGSVRALLSHSAECPNRELREVEYRHDRLIFTTQDGDRIFDDMKVNDEDVMSDFSERDARAFVREFRRFKAARGRQH